MAALDLAKAVIDYFAGVQRHLRRRPARGPVGPAVAHADDLGRLEDPTNGQVVPNSAKAIDANTVRFTLEFVDVNETLRFFVTVHVTTIRAPPSSASAPHRDGGSMTLRVNDISMTSIIRAAGLHFFACLKRLAGTLAAQGLDRVCHSALVGADVSPKAKGGDSFFLPTHYRITSRKWQEPFAMNENEKRSGLMQKRTLKVAILAVLAIILVLGILHGRPSRTRRGPTFPIR